jgi:hypothetical protein
MEWEFLGDLVCFFEAGGTSALLNPKIGEMRVRLKVGS